MVYQMTVQNAYESIYPVSGLCPIDSFCCSLSNGQNMAHSLAFNSTTYDVYSMLQQPYSKVSLLFSAKQNWSRSLTCCCSIPQVWHFCHSSPRKSDSEDSSDWYNHFRKSPGNWSSDFVCKRAFSRLFSLQLFLSGGRNQWEWLKRGIPHPFFDVRPFRQSNWNKSSAVLLWDELQREFPRSKCAGGRRRSFRSILNVPLGFDRLHPDIRRLYKSQSV